MDGGRILRAVLASFCSFRTATLIAGSVGQVLAVALVVYGFLSAIYSLVVIGVFVFVAASIEVSQYRNVFGRGEATIWDDIEQ